MTYNLYGFFLRDGTRFGRTFLKHDEYAFWIFKYFFNWDLDSDATTAHPVYDSVLYKTV